MPFEVPESWEWVRLDTIGDIVTGSTPPKDNKEFYGGHIPFYKPTDLEQGINTTISTDTLTEQGFAVARKLPRDTILVTCIGATIGKTGIIRKTGTCNQQINAIVSYPSVYPEYIYYVCISYYMQSCIKENASATTLPILNKNHFAELQIPLPPLVEQKRIVAAVELWFSLIDTLESARDDLQKSITQAKSKILDLAIHGKLVPQDPNDEPAVELLKRINPKFTPCDNGHDKNIPAKWCRCFVGDIANIIGGVSYKKDDVQSDGIRILRGGNIQNGKVLIEADDIFVSNAYYNSENEVKDGDIIVVSSTGSSTLIGKTGFADNMPRVTQIGAFLRILRFSHYLSRDFINLVFLSEEYKEYIRNIAKGSNINNIKNSYLSDYSIAIPPYNEQLRIVAKIEEIFAVLDEIQKSIED